MCQISINSEHFGTNLGLTGGKCFIKISFDTRIKIDIFEISIKPNFNKSKSTYLKYQLILSINEKYF